MDLANIFSIVVALLLMAGGIFLYSRLLMLLDAIEELLSELKGESQTP